ncbi:TM2 domain-containing protein [Entomospira entomophila]|uniref:TM2 domain-containing protein n=1 Tax=Entomospira entomophila TaxID=2719988 RepID=A0A968KTA4_9SPIO|nr:TM2 domain-containing protein [Entomospira entomophilus]NIZ40096.1 TM2 domain-containing protein [Entomospira entomophilus]WDI35656.1 TM2 domain-containing protein [Entomospira entomophilus]
MSKNWLMTLLFAIFLGSLGVHRFYVGRPVSGIVWILTLGFFGIGTIVDIIMIVMGKFKDGQGNYVTE